MSAPFKSLTPWFFLFFGLFVWTQGNSQCYIQLGDYSGFDTSPYLEGLDAVACDLVRALPPEFRNQFRVYSFAFYSLNAYMDGGEDHIWQDVIRQSAQRTPYYLIFGKESSSRGIFATIRVAVHLPPAESFGCPQKINAGAIEYYLTTLLNPNSSPYAYPKKEADAMNYLMQLISCREICGNDIDDDGDGWSDCNDSDCAEAGGISLRSGPVCQGQAVFREHPEQKFGFDENTIKSYPTYKTPFGEGTPWKSVGVGQTDMVIVEFSPGIDLSAIRYRATGVEMMSGDTPRSYSETITLQAPSPTKSASIEVLDGNGSVIGALNVVVLPKREMVLNLILMKLPGDATYPKLNFTETELEEVMIQAFKQINMSWSIKPIDRYEWDFDKNGNGKMDDQEYYYILAEYLWIEQDSLRKLRYYPDPDENPLLYNKTSTMFLYSPLGTDEKGQQINGSFGFETIYGFASSTYQYNKRTIAHENGHRIGLKHPWEEFKGLYAPFSDADALMDYVNIINGYKIRAYQW